MQIQGHIGRNTFYYSSSDFQEDLDVSVELFYEVSNELLLETLLEPLRPGVYQFEYEFNMFGKYLVLLSQNDKLVLLCTILIKDGKVKYRGIHIPGVI